MEHDLMGNLRVVLLAGGAFAVTLTLAALALEAMRRAIHLYMD